MTTAPMDTPHDDSEPASTRDAQPLGRRHALVTGTQTPLGGALAEALESAGAAVTTLTTAEACSAATGAVATATGPRAAVDLVVVVVAEVPAGAYATSPADGWAASVSQSATAVLAVVRGCWDELQHAAADGGPADVVLVTPHARGPAAGVARSAVVEAAAGITRALRAEGAGAGIRVHHLRYGSLRDTADEMSRPEDVLRSEDVASVVTFVVTAQASTNVADLTLLATRED